MSVKIQTERFFEKDTKKIHKRKKDLAKLKEVAEILASGKKLLDKHRNHKLVGNYQGLLGCHIEHSVTHNF